MRCSRRSRCLLVLNVAEGDVAAPAPEALARAAPSAGSASIVLSARVEMDIAQLDASEQGEFLASIGLAEPAVHRFIRAAFALIDLISMLTAGPTSAARGRCRAERSRRARPARSTATSSAASSAPR
jgi:ribosome-binding ATPase YchF (GTP1/OBG family)